MEELNTEGFLFTEVAGEWAVLTADFGDGYQAAALVGDPQGTRTWSIRIDVLPGQRATLVAEPGGEWLMTESGEGVGVESQARAQYLWSFFRARKAAGDEPFWIETEDPEDAIRKKYLAGFVDHRLSFQVLCAKVYTTGLMLRQRRVAGVESPVVV